MYDVKPVIIMLRLWCPKCFHIVVLSFSYTDMVSGVYYTLCNNGGNQGPQITSNLQILYGLLNTARKLLMIKKYA